MLLERFRPELQGIIRKSFKGFTPIREQAMPSVLDGKNTLVIAPTGSGSTGAPTTTTDSSVAVDSANTMSMGRTHYIGSKCDSNPDTCYGLRATSWSARVITEITRM